MTSLLKIEIVEEPGKPRRLRMLIGESTIDLDTRTAPALGTRLIALAAIAQAQDEADPIKVAPSGLIVA